MPLAEQAEIVTVTVSDTDEELVPRNDRVDEVATDELVLDNTPQLPKAVRQPSPQ
jgi:hypothetical protein